jgi:hypothetical protein
MAPLVVFGIGGFDGAGIEQNAPQALIYGWVLQFGYALFPYLFRRIFLPQQPARLGGNWFSLMTVNLGGVFLWASIFGGVYQAPLHGMAYTLWALSFWPIASDLWQVVRRSFAQTTADGSADVTQTLVAAD